jgi:hypothetical protein
MCENSQTHRTTSLSIAIGESSPIRGGKQARATHHQNTAQFERRSAASKKHPVAGGLADNLRKKFPSSLALFTVGHEKPADT